MKYELTYLVKGDLNEKDWQNIAGQVKDEVSKAKGEVKNEFHWGRRNLAYPIAKQEFAYYSTLEYQAEGKTPAQIERALRLNNNVIRFLTTLAYATPVSLTEKPTEDTEESRSAEELLRRSSTKKAASKKPAAKKVKAEDEKKRQAQVEEALGKILGDEDEAATKKEQK